MGEAAPSPEPREGASTSLGTGAARARDRRLIWVMATLCAVTLLVVLRLATDPDEEERFRRETLRAIGDMETAAYAVLPIIDRLAAEPGSVGATASATAATIRRRSAY